jgi:hypothetical protein
LEGHAVLLPARWPIDVTNALQIAGRRKRVKQAEIRRFVELLSERTIVMDSRSVTNAVSNILPLGGEDRLSAYDAAYFDVAIRHGAPRESGFLAELDHDTFEVSAAAHRNRADLRRLMLLDGSMLPSEAGALDPRVLTVCYWSIANVLVKFNKISTDRA